MTLLESTNLEEYRAAGGNSDSGKNQNIVDRLVRREVLCCVSSLMSTISAVASERGKFGDTEYEEISALMECPPDYEEAAREEDWEVANDLISEVAEARDEAKLKALYDAIDGEPEHEAYPNLDRIIEVIQMGNANEFIKLTKRPGSNHGWEVDESSADDWEDLCREQRIEPDRREVFEHWVVTSWVADKLRDYGHPVGDVEGLTVYGRPTTGQSMCLDTVWRSIAAGMKILEGQANDWSRGE
jgi:hypothetical protein